MLPAGERIISNVVMMGMGEPMLNFDNTVTSLHLMLDDNAYGLSRRRVTVIRDWAEALRRHGHRIQMYRLQGNLVFTSAEHIVRDVMRAALNHYGYKPPQMSQTLGLAEVDKAKVCR